MKKVIIIVLGIFLIFNTSAQKVVQDTLLFPDYSRDVKDILTYPCITQEKDLTLYGAAAVLISTFIINEAIIRHDARCGNYEHTTTKTGIVYLTGFTVSVIVFSFEVKKHKKKNNVIIKY